MVHNRRLRLSILNLNLLAFGANQISLYTLVPVLLTRTSLELSKLILAFSVGTLLFLPGSIFWSSRSDRGAPERVLFWNVLFLLVATSSVTLCFFRPSGSGMSFILILVGRIVYGLGASGIPSVSQKVRLDSGHEMLKGLSAHSTALTLGRFLAPCLFLLPWAPGPILFAMNLSLVILVALNGWLALAGKRSAAGVLEVQTGHGPRVTPAFLLTLSFTLVIGVLHSSLGPWLKERLGLTGEEATSMMAKLLLVGALMMVLIQFSARRIQDHEWRKLLITGGVLLAAGLLVLTFAQAAPFFYLGTMAVFLGIGLLQPASVLFMEELSPGEEGRGRRLGKLSAANTLGHGLGGLLFAVMPLPLELMSFLLAITLLVLCFKTACPDEVEAKVC